MIENLLKDIQRLFAEAEIYADCTMKDDMISCNVSSIISVFDNPIFKILSDKYEGLLYLARPKNKKFFKIEFHF